MAYDTETVRKNQKGFKICKLLFAESTYPKDLADKLEYSEGTVRNVLRELRRLEFVEKGKTEKRGNLEYQYYNLQIEALVDYWIERNRRFWAIRESEEQSRMIANDLYETKQEYAEELFEIEEELEKDISEERKSKLEERWRHLRSWLGYLVATFRITDEEMIEIYEKRKEWVDDPEKETNYSPGHEIEAINAGRDPKGVRELIRNYISEYFGNINESSLEKMLFEDLERSVMSFSWFFQLQDIEFEAMMTVANIYWNRKYVFQEDNPYTCLSNAAMRHSQLNKRGFLEDITDIAIEKGEITPEEKEDTINELLEGLKSLDFR